MMDDEQSQEDLAEAANKLVDKNLLRSVERKIKDAMPMGHSFDDVVKLEEYTDTQDPFYIILFEQ